MYDPLILIFGSAGLILLALFGLAFIREVRKQAKTPSEQDVISAVENWLYKGLYVAEKIAANQLRNEGKTLSGLDKKAIADSLYAIIPNTVAVGEIVIPLSLVKLVVPRDRFEALVQDAFDHADAFIEQNAKYLESQIGKNAPDAPMLDVDALVNKFRQVVSETVQQPTAQPQQPSETPSVTIIS